MAALCILPHSTAAGALLELTLPDNESKGKFLISESNFYRAVSYDLDGSVTIDQTVSNPKNMLALHPFDVNFILLKYFENSARPESFCSITQILEENNAESLENFGGLTEAAKKICEVKENNGSFYFRVSNETKFAWLKSKVDRLANEINSRYPEFHAETPLDKCFYIALCIMRELLSPETYTSLIEHCGYEQKQVEAVMVRQTKREPEYDDEFEEEKKKPLVIKKVKKEVVRPKGVNAITSFFTKK